MEQKSNLGLRDAAVTRRAAIDAKVTNIQYKGILDSQRRINSLEIERSKISEKETDLYGQYTNAIDKAKQEQSGMIESYGKMEADQRAQLENLKQEGIYRKENYNTLNQVGELDKQIGENSFIAKINANSKMKGVYKDEISEIKDLYSNAKNTADMQYASKREQELFARASASNNTGLNFIDSHENTCGKSSIVAAIYYCLGFEQIIGGTGGVGSKVLTSVFKSIIEDNGKPWRVTESGAYLEICNGNEIRTLYRNIKSEYKDNHLVTVYFGDYDSIGDYKTISQDYYA